MKQLGLIASTMVVLLLFSFSPAKAGDGNFGIRAGYYTDVEEVFAGAEFLTKVAPQIYFNPNVEYVFVDGGTLMTFNGDFHYDFPTGGKNFIWAGAGLGVAYLDPDGPVDSSTEANLNLITGIAFPTRSVTPYFQLKVIVGDADDLVLGFGVRF